MIQFVLKFMIYGMISILVSLISRSLMAMSIGVPHMECIYLNLFVSLEHLLTLVTSIVVTKPLMQSSLNRAIDIINFVRRFQSFIADTVDRWENIMYQN